MPLCNPLHLEMDDYLGSMGLVGPSAFLKNDCNNSPNVAIRKGCEAELGALSEKVWFCLLLCLVTVFEPLYLTVNKPSPTPS